MPSWLLSGLGGSNAKVFGIPVYGMRDSAWYRPLIRGIHRVAYLHWQRWYYFKSRFIRRDHMLTLPIPGEWCDSDERMFLACFEVLGWFVETELGKATVSTECQYRGYRLHSGGGYDEHAIDLWHWYKHELPKLDRDYHDDLRACYSGEWVTRPAAHGLVEIVDFGRVREPKYPHDWPSTVRDEKLRELIDLRPALWT